MSLPTPSRHPWHPINETNTTIAAASSSSPPATSRIQIPKTRQLKFRLGLPRFCDMERKFASGTGNNANASGSDAGKGGALAPHESAAERWRTLVHEMLVEVVDQQGKAVVIARHLLVKSGNDHETDYNYALKYILKLLYKDADPATFIKEHPNFRLQAWFEDSGNPSRVGGGGYGRYLDIDPDSWSEVWSFADRICVVY